MMIGVIIAAIAGIVVYVALGPSPGVVAGIATFALWYSIRQVRSRLRRRAHGNGYDGLDACSSHSSGRRLPPSTDRRSVARVAPSVVPARAHSGRSCSIHPTVAQVSVFTLTVARVTAATAAGMAMVEGTAVVATGAATTAATRAPARV